MSEEKYVYEAKLKSPWPEKGFWCRRACSHYFGILTSDRLGVFVSANRLVYSSRLTEESLHFYSRHTATSTIFKI
jgi:hypothetical protein